MSLLLVSIVTLQLIIFVSKQCDESILHNVLRVFMLESHKTLLKQFEKNKEPISS